MMRTTHMLRLLALGAVVVGGCAKDDKDAAVSATKTSNPMTDSASGSDTGAAMTEGGTTVLGTTGVDETTGAVMTAAPTTGGCMFLCESDMPGGGECDIWMEDCPEGSKCMPWDNTGGGSWNSTKCSPVDANPGLEGDPCTVEGSAVSGIDSCDKHLLCWFVDAMNVGTCINMCTGSAEAPTCPGGQTCDISNNGSLILCLQTCDPLVQSCPEGQICFFGIDNFICDFDASGEEGKYGDPCAFINVCDYGLFCAAPESVPGCESGDGCCSEYCNINEPNTCAGAPQQQCVPWYDGMPPPGQEDIGGCAIPQ